MTGRIQKTVASVLVAAAIIAGKVALRSAARAERAEESAAEQAALQQASTARAPIPDGEAGAPAAPATPAGGQARTVAQSASLAASQTTVPPAAVPPAPASAPIATAAATAAAANARTAETGAAAAAPAVPAAPAGPATVAAAEPAAPRPADDRAVARTGRSVSVSVDGSGTEQDAPELTLVRETFSYAGQGRRDPFVSLMDNGDLRPTLGELRLVGVAYDPSGRGSVAVMRDIGTKEQYRVRVGQALGRMRVARIQQKQVLFTIEEFGFSRQEVLALGDSTTARVK